jgi:hypothetical protein
MDPSPVAGRSSRSVAVVALAIALAIAIGLATLAVVGGSEPDRSLASTAAATPTAGPSALVRLSSTPPAVRCHDVSSGPCSRIAAAAVDAIGDPGQPARTVDVWSTLLCDSTFDCPSYHLADRRPAGSAVVGLSDSAVLWVNVAEIEADADRGSQDPTLDAWVVPSGPMN